MVAQLPSAADLPAAEASVEGHLGRHLTFAIASTCDCGSKLVSADGATNRPDHGHPEIGPQDRHNAVAQYPARHHDSSRHPPTGITAYVGERLPLRLTSDCSRDKLPSFLLVVVCPGSSS